jgi:hypothetical protein
MEAQTVTVGLALIAIGCAGGGFGFAFWHSGQLHRVKDEILTEVRRSHVEPSDEKAKVLAAEADALATRLHDLELYVERNFLSKSTANLVFERLEKGLGEIRSAVEASRSSADARLIRIEGHLQPSSHLPPQQRPRS